MRFQLGYFGKKTKIRLLANRLQNFISTKMTNSTK